jgi:hypothetical protein
VHKVAKYDGNQGVKLEVDPGVAGQRGEDILEGLIVGRWTQDLGTVQSQSGEEDGGTLRIRARDGASRAGDASVSPARPELGSSCVENKHTAVVIFKPSEQTDVGRRTVLRFVRFPHENRNAVIIIPSCLRNDGSGCAAELRRPRKVSERRCVCRPDQAGNLRTQRLHIHPPPPGAKRPKRPSPRTLFLARP